MDRFIKVVEENWKSWRRWRRGPERRRIFALWCGRVWALAARWAS